MKTTYESFNENEKVKVTASEIFEKIKKDFSDMDICGLFDEEIMSGNWIDSDQMEEEEYESEYDYYTDFGRGEAESAVFEEILKKYGLEYTDFVDGEFEELQVLLSDYSGVNFN
ncbi:hypothetical protein M0Q97_09405 [Candidatus Dojkabacteria bacterium]|jgi:hypothetical protein|nr:hypothetical protein [Candidatus Dojkabacteria bacterium]